MKPLQLGSIGPPKGDFGGNPVLILLDCREKQILYTFPSRDGGWLTLGSIGAPRTPFAQWINKMKLGPRTPYIGILQYVALRPWRVLSINLWKVSINIKKSNPKLYKNPQYRSNLAIVLLQETFRKNQSNMRHPVVFLYKFIFISQWT